MHTRIRLESAVRRRRKLENEQSNERGKEKIEDWKKWYVGTRFENGTVTDDPVTPLQFEYFQMNLKIIRDLYLFALI